MRCTAVYINKGQNASFTMLCHVIYGRKRRMNVTVKKDFKF